MIQKRIKIEIAFSCRRCGAGVAVLAILMHIQLPEMLFLRACPYVNAGKLAFHELATDADIGEDKPSVGIIHIHHVPIPVCVF